MLDWEMTGIVMKKANNSIMKHHLNLQKKWTTTTMLKRLIAFLDGILFVKLLSISPSLESRVIRVFRLKYWLIIYLNNAKHGK